MVFFVLVVTFAVVVLGVQFYSYTVKQANKQ